jgi:enoyl-CoA hydratase
VQAEHDRDEARRLAAADKASNTAGQGTETKRGGSTGPAKAPAARAAVRVDRSGPVTTVILDRPEVRNAVDGPTAALLAEAFADFDADADASVAVLFGAGGTFCAGADLKALGSENGNSTAPDGNGPMGPTRMRLSKPVIAAVAGHAVAGGLELALWCDLRIAEEDAVFGVFCRRWGVPLIDGGTVRLPQVVGLGRALDMILTGRPVPAAEAYQMGLVNKVVNRGAAREQAEELALEIAALPQACLRSDRASALEAAALSFDDAMAGEFEHGMAVLTDPAVIEGVARFRGGAGRGGSPA